MDLLNFFGSFVVLLEAVMGLLFSTLIIYLYYSGESDRTSFNFICVTRAVNNIFVLLLQFLCLMFPVLLLSSNIFPISIETYIIASTINVYMVNSYHCVLIGVNRFIAMFIPFHYSKLCGMKVTMVILALLYLERIYATIVKLLQEFDNHCRVHISLDSFGPHYEDSTCSKRLKDGFDGILIVLIPLGIFAFTVILNLITFVKIMQFYIGVKEKKTFGYLKFIQRDGLDTNSSASMKNNIRLFFQTVLQDSLFFVDVLFTFKLSTLSEDRLWFFISQVFVWESIHMLDGFIMLMFSNRLSILKSKFSFSKQNTVGNLENGRASHTLPEIG
ncbi:hypothetical protein CRE_18911 [Caenorhabditis remanei]|uniref:G-protein coupled receptors family 1 profile domain-containing protein n=1 Tax=Caenorhabditis remanei TaxID=31234 RepID=E3LJW1_CAERE|nr:hypothetical protein CRE_18911 [Caenorhabditis remanei]